MIGILAIETSTDACSVAVSVDGTVRAACELAPQRHSQLLFAMLRDLLPDGDLRATGIEALAYGCGPGSFTGLRIAASAVQGLAYASDLPVVPVSTLAVLAQTALRKEIVSAQASVLCSLDARMNEIYSAVYHYENGLAKLADGPRVSAPAALAEFYSAESCPGGLYAAGSGSQFFDQFPPRLQQKITGCSEDLMPEAQDMIPLALASFRHGETQSAIEVQPVYVRNEVTWKKLSEQGKSNK